VCKALAADQQVVIMCAAVADYRPVATRAGKWKKGEEPLRLDLEPTEDILLWLGEHKPPGQVLVGFALETDNELEHARAKLERKHLDLLVLNSLRDEGAGFQHETNMVTLLEPGKDPAPQPLMPKADVARVILDRIEALL
jgi:phosphopantothenoylcysteine decarboxylase/phosphopantothenate--cysteine ligase